MKQVNNKIHLIIALVCVSSILVSQNVAINSGANAAVTGAILDLSNNNATNGTAGFLPPWVTLTNSTTLSPVTGTPANLAGLMVYNTSTSTSNGLCGPGLYYWNGSSWIALFVSNVSTPVAPSNITCSGYNTLAAGISTIQYATTAVTGATTYAWTSSNPTVFTVPSSTTTPTVTITTVGAGTASLTVQAVYACSNSLSSPGVSITVISNPTMVTATGSSSGVVPCYGTSTPAVYIYGGGGGGGGSNRNSPNDFMNGGGGGGGVCGVFTTSPTFNTGYTYTVGLGGAAGSTTSPCTGGTGGTTTFTQTTPAGTWTAVGGTGGAGQTNTATTATASGGAGSAIVTGVGITPDAGGTGSTGYNNPGYTGSGGGGGGSGAAGTSPTNGSCGGVAAGGTGTYPGGAGGYNTDCNTSNNLAGIAGSQPGGGGSGDCNWSATEGGGAGGAGELIIVW